MVDATATETLPPATPDPQPVDALTRLRNARGWIFDMDGVLYRGNERLPGRAASSERDAQASRVV